MDTKQVIDKLTDKTREVFLTHVQGFDGLTDELIGALKQREIPLIEDVCESHGATHNGQKLGTFGWISNFSFYYAHHMSTIEGGMVCTDEKRSISRYACCAHTGWCVNPIIRTFAPVTKPTTRNSIRNSFLPIPPTICAIRRSVGSWDVTSSNGWTPILRDAPKIFTGF